MFNIILLVILNLIVKPLYIFGIDLKIQNVLGEESYGTYFEILSLVFLFNIINDIGINTHNTKEISQDSDLVYNKFKNVIGLKLLLGLAFLIVLSVVFHFLNLNPTKNYLLLLVAIVFIFNSFFVFLRSNLSGLGMYKTDSLISVVDRVALIIIMVYILYFMDTTSFQIEYFLYAQIASFIIGIIIARLALVKVLPDFKINISFNFSKKLLVKSYPYAIAVTLMTIFSRMDGVMLGLLLTDNGKEAGIYAAGYRLLDAGNMFAYLFASLLLPMYSKLLINKKKLQELSELAYKLIWVYVTILCVVFLFYNTEIAKLLIIEGDKYYGSILAILMFSLIGIAISYIYGTMIVAKGQMKQLNFIFLICIVINLILNLILIPKYSAYGAAIATLITQIIAMIGQLVLCHHTMQLKYNLRMYLLGIVYAVICILIFYSINNLSYKWHTSMMLNIILSLIIAFIMKMIDFKFFLKLLKSKQDI